MKNAQKMIYKKYRSEVLATLFALFALSFLFFYLSARFNNTIAPGRDSVGISVTPVTTLTNPSEIINENGMKTYKSDFMKVEFEYPSSYGLEARYNDINLIHGITGKGITFSKSGSMFKSVQEHVDNAISKWYQLPLKRELIISNGLDGEVVDQVVSGVSYRIIYFVKNYSVYQFETGDVELFPDLELIAKSFKILD